MRVIEYPPKEEEQQVRCRNCKALIGYVPSEMQWRLGISNDRKVIICPCCDMEIVLDTLPHPDVARFLSGLWAEEVKQ